MGSRAFFATATFVAAYMLATSAIAQTLLIVADHRDPSSIPSSDDIYRVAYEKIAERLQHKGWSVRRPEDFPGTRKMQSKIERNLGLAVTVAKNSPARISTVVGLKIFVSMHRGAKNNSFFLWIDGEARDVAFGKALTKHEIRSKKRHTVEKSCGRDCMLERAVDAIPPTATRFGEEFAGKLGKAK